MARLSRISPAGVPVHIIQRGNNRQACSVSDEDHSAYARWLKEYSAKFRVDIHAWVMMTNHEYRRRGTLWEEPYLLEVYKYIELNPVRAEMVQDPGEYRWSRIKECTSIVIPKNKQSRQL